MNVAGNSWTIAADRLAWERLLRNRHGELLRYANNCFRGTTHIAPDGEGAVQSALVSFWKGLKEERFRFEDESGLIRLLMKLVRRKVVKQLRSANRLRRGGGRAHVRIDGSLADGRGADVRDPRAAPAESAEIKDELRRLFATLPDADSAQIAILKMEGCTDQEAADALGIARATVVRKLALIRTLWASQAQKAG